MEALTGHIMRSLMRFGLFDKQFSKIVHSAFDTRQDNDYEDFYVPSEAEAQEQYENATRFIGEIERKRELFIKGKLSLPTITQ
jgi:hypothetical protein